MALKAFRSTIDDNSSFDAFNSQVRYESARWLITMYNSRKSSRVVADAQGFCGCVGTGQSLGRECPFDSGGEAYVVP
jgi:hypothetical protein